MAAVGVADERLVIRLDSGSPFLRTPESVAEAVREHLGAGGGRTIIITFTDQLIPLSQVVAVIMQCSKIAIPFHAVIAVVTPNAELKQSLRTIGIDRVAKLCDSESDL